MDWLESARQKTAQVLRKRKQLKKMLTLAAEQFNIGRKDWIKYAQAFFFIIIIISVSPSFVLFCIFF